MALFGLNLAITWRLFEAEYTTQFSSIDGSFIAIARYLSKHWGDSAWWPLWHCGMPYQDTYVPLLHLVVAAVASLGHIPAARAYHEAVAVAYSMGPPALYLMAVRLGAHRGAAFFSALFYSLLSPSALLIPAVAKDVGGLWYCRRLQVLTVYGEGPHISSMSLVPLAILGLESTLARRSRQVWVLSAIAIALVFLTNVPGTMGLGLAVFCWICAQQKEQRFAAWVFAASASILAYCLACYGLPPSSIRTVLGNVGEMHHGFSNSLKYGPVLLILALAAVSLSGRLLVRLRLPLTARFALLYFGLLAGLSIPANSETFELLPQAGRLQLEMEIGACLLLGWAAWSAFRLVPRWLTPIAVVLLLAPIGVQFENYRLRVELDTKPADLEKRSEFTSARWLETHLPGRRVYATGSTEFWLNAFAEIPQMTGCCDQGNSIPALDQVPFFVNHATGTANTVLAKAWLEVFGVQALVVNGESSSDEYKDFADPGRFEGVFQPLYRQNGDTIYRVLPEGASLAHVLRSQDLLTAPPPKPVYATAVLKYAEVLAARPNAAFEWVHGGLARIRASLRKDDLVLVQEAWFPGWKAFVGGARRNLFRDGLGFLVIQPECQGACEITIEWTGRPDLPFAALLSLYWRCCSARPC